MTKAVVILFFLAGNAGPGLPPATALPPFGVPCSWLSAATPAQPAGPVDHEPPAADPVAEDEAESEGKRRVQFDRALGPPRRRHALALRGCQALRLLLLRSSLKLCLMATEGHLQI